MPDKEVYIDYHFIKDVQIGGNLTVTGTVPTWNQDTTGNADTATALETARTIGGVSFDGTANINLPGVNAAGTQDTTGNALTATTAATAQAGDSATDFFSSGTIADARIASASTWNAKQDALTFGIANTNAVKIDHASVADNDFAKFTASGLEGRSYAEVKSDLSLNNVENTALSTWAGSSNITTLGTISGPLIITGNLQVSGTIDTINETNTDLVDKTLTLAVNSTSSSDSNEAGITVAGADAKLQYLHSGTKWSFNKSVAATSFIGPLTGDVTGNLTGNVTGNSDTVTTNANLTGDVTSSGNATSIAAGVIVNADINASAGIAYSKMEASSNAPTWNQNTTGTASNVTGTVAIANGGTGATSASGARTALGVDQAGTDNSTNVTLSGTPDYITISGQTITRNQIDLAADVTGVLPDANISSAATWNAMLPLAGGTLTGNVLFGDNVKATFGDSTTPDLEIYHDGSHRYLNETGTGGLVVKGSTLYLRNPSDEDMIYAASGAEVSLYHNNVKKFDTNTSGVSVFGSLYFDGVSSSYIDNASHDLQMRGAGGVSLWTHTGGSWVEQVTVADAGGVTLSGSLTATGATLIGDGSNGELYVSRSSGAVILTQAQAAAGKFGTTSNHDLQLMTNNTVYARLTNDGKFGVGIDPATSIHTHKTSGHNSAYITTDGNSSSSTSLWFAHNYTTSADWAGIIWGDDDLLKIVNSGASSANHIVLNDTGHVSLNSTDLSSYGHFGVLQPAGGNTDGIAVVNGTQSFRLYVDDAGYRRINAGSASVVEFNSSIFNVYQPVQILSDGASNNPAHLSLWSKDTSIAGGDEIGSLLGQGSDNASSPPLTGAKINFTADHTWDGGTANYQSTRIDFFTQDNSGTNTLTSPRMTIASTGAITAFGNLTIQRSSGNYMQIGHDSDTHYISTVGSNRDLHISASGAVDAADLKISSDGDATFSGQIIQRSLGSYGEATADDLIIGNSDGNGGMTIVSDTDDLGAIYFSDGVNGNQRYQGYIQYEQSAARFTFGTEAAFRVAITGTGIGCGTTAPSAKIHTLSSGSTYAGHFSSNSTTPYGVYIEASQGPASNIAAGYPMLKVAESGSGGIVYFSVSSGGKSFVHRLGVNVAADASDALLIKSTADGTNALSITDNAGDAMFNIRQSANDCLIRAYKDGGSQKVQIHTDGDSYFNGGKIGLNTTSPAQMLSVLNGKISVSDGYNIGSHDGDTGMYDDEDNDIRWQVGGSHLMTLQEHGRLGLNTAQPSRLLDIASTASDVFPLKIRGNIDNNGGYTGIVFGYEADTTNYEKAAIMVEGTSGNVQPNMYFLLHPGANSTNASKAWSVLTLKNSGDVEMPLGNLTVGTLTGHPDQDATRLAGYSTTSNYGSYGGLLFHATAGHTSGARRFLLTNAYGTNKFGIIRSADATSDPDLSGTADLYIDNTGNVAVAVGNFSTTNSTNGYIAARTYLQLTAAATPTSGSYIGKLYAYNDTNAMLYYKDGADTAHALHSASDYRLKENITDYSGDDAVALVKAAQVKRFDFKENRCPEEHRMNRVGFLAHELQEAGCDLGAVVSLEKAAVDN